MNEADASAGRSGSVKSIAASIVYGNPSQTEVKRAGAVRSWIGRANGF
jgi:hypothetical protein